MINENPFSTTFGIEPDNFIARIKEQDQIISEFSSGKPSNYVYLITGVRGSGKTVMLTALANYFRDKKDWLVIDPGPKDNILENIASEIYENGKMKYAFLKGEFSFSFHGLTFSIKGKEPVTTVNTLLKKMLDIIKKKNIKVLITIDEVDNSLPMKLFIQEYQSLIRQNYPVLLLMTGLYENVSKLQENKTLTFLYRAPKIQMGPLALNSIALNYEQRLGVSKDISVKLAKLTKGYAYAYQVLGYLMFKQKKSTVDNELLSLFDQYLSDYVYDKVYAGISAKEQEILKSFKTDESIKTKDLCINSKITIQYLSVYRKRLINEGIIVAPSYGSLEFALPRFNEFLQYK